MMKLAFGFLFMYLIQVTLTQEGNDLIARVFFSANRDELLSKAKDLMTDILVNVTRSEFSRKLSLIQSQNKSEIDEMLLLDWVGKRVKDLSCPLVVNGNDEASDIAEEVVTIQNQSCYEEATRYSGTDMAGSVIRVMQQGTVQACQGACRNNSECQYFLYFDKDHYQTYKHRTCRLLKFKGSSAKNQKGHISGPKMCEKSKEFFKVKTQIEDELTSSLTTHCQALSERNAALATLDMQEDIESVGHRICNMSRENLEKLSLQEIHSWFYLDERQFPNLAKLFNTEIESFAFLFNDELLQLTSINKTLRKLAELCSDLVASQEHLAGEASSDANSSSRSEEKNVGDTIPGMEESVNDSSDMSLDGLVPELSMGEEYPLEGIDQGRDDKENEGSKEKTAQSNENTEDVQITRTKSGNTEDEGNHFNNDEQQLNEGAGANRAPLTDKTESTAADDYYMEEEMGFYLDPPEEYDLYFIPENELELGTEEEPGPEIELIVGDYDPEVEEGAEPEVELEEEYEQEMEGESESEWKSEEEYEPEMEEEYDQGIGSEPEGENENVEGIEFEAEASESKVDGGFESEPEAEGESESGAEMGNKSKTDSGGNHYETETRAESQKGAESEGESESEAKLEGPEPEIEGEAEEEVEYEQETKRESELEGEFESETEGEWASEAESDGDYHPESEGASEGEGRSESGEEHEPESEGESEIAWESGSEHNSEAEVEPESIEKVEMEEEFEAEADAVGEKELESKAESEVKPESERKSKPGREKSVDESEMDGDAKVQAKAQKEAGENGGVSSENSIDSTVESHSGSNSGVQIEEKSAEEAAPGISTHSGTGSEDSAESEGRPEGEADAEASEPVGEGTAESESEGKAESESEGNPNTILESSGAESEAKADGDPKSEDTPNPQEEAPERQEGVGSSATDDEFIDEFGSETDTKRSPKNKAASDGKEITFDEIDLSSGTKGHDVQEQDADYEGFVNEFKPAEEKQDTKAEPLSDKQGEEVLEEEELGFDIPSHKGQTLNGNEVTADDNEEMVNDNEVTADNNEVAADGNEVIAEDKEVTAGDNDVAADGNEVTADGNEVTANGNEVTAEDKEVTADGNEVIAEDKEITAGDNEVIADGNEVTADGNEVTADGNEVAADGNEVIADENEVAADGNEVTADGNEVAADENEVAADENEVAADGNEVAADGNEVIADGNSTDSRIDSNVLQVVQIQTLLRSASSGQGFPNQNENSVDENVIFPDEVDNVASSTALSSATTATPAPTTTTTTSTVLTTTPTRASSTTILNPILTTVLSGSNGSTRQPLTRGSGGNYIPLWKRYLMQQRQSSANMEKKKLIGQPEENGNSDMPIMIKAFMGRPYVYGNYVEPPSPKTFFWQPFYHRK